MWPAWRIRYSSRRNSRGKRSMAAAGTGHGARQQIHLEIADDEPRLGAAPARQRLQPRQQLGEGERLGQIVVATGTQALDPILDVTQRAQHQHRRLIARRAQRRDDRQPVDTGQHAVDDHGVEGVVRRTLEPLAALCRQIDAVPALGQPSDQVIGCFAVIFDNQNAHGFHRRDNIGDGRIGAQRRSCRPRAVSRCHRRSPATARGTR